MTSDDLNNKNFSSDDSMSWAEFELFDKHECGSDSKCEICLELRDPNFRSRVQQAQAEYSSKVGCLNPSLKKLCVYCGALANQLDHLLPLPWTGKAVRSLVPTVPACGNCNRTINDFPNPSIMERSMLVAASLRKKHAKNLRIADRSEDEFQEFEGLLQMSLRARQFERQYLRSRLSVLDCGGLPEIDARTVEALLEGQYEVVSSYCP